MVKETNTDEVYVVCVTEMWIKPKENVALNEASPHGYSYIHRSHLNGRGSGITINY